MIRYRGWSVDERGELHAPHKRGLVCGLGMGLGLGHGVGGSVASITQSLIAEFGGFWADPNYGSGPTMAAAPTNKDWNMEDAGTAAYTAELSGVLTKETGTPHGGTQCLRCTGPTGAGCYQIGIAGNRLSVDQWMRVDAATTTGRFGNLSNITGSNSTTSTTWAHVQCDGMLNSAGMRIVQIATATGTGWVECDDVSISNLSITAITPRFAAALNCLADGDCSDAGTAAWTVGAGGGSLSKSGGALRVTSVTTATCARQVLVTGRQYRLTGTARGDGGSGIPRVNMSAAVWTGTNSVSDQAIDVTFTAGSANCDLYNSGTSGYADFNNLVLTDVSTPAGILAQSTATSQPWHSSTTVNGKRVLQSADTDVLLGSLAAPAYRFLHCGSGGTLPLFIYSRNINSSSLSAVNTLLCTYAAASKAGIWVYVTTAGAITVTWYDAAGFALQTAASANGAVVVGTSYVITVWSDGANFGVLKNGAAAIAATALSFTPDMTVPSNYQSGNGTSTPIVGSHSNEVLVAGYRDAASTLALHREQAAQWGIAA